MILKCGRTACICSRSYSSNRWTVRYFPPTARLGLPASTNVRNAKYPQIMPDHRVLFRVKAPDAQRVQVDLVRKYDLQKDTGGYWTGTTDSVERRVSLLFAAHRRRAAGRPGKRDLLWHGPHGERHRNPVCRWRLLCDKRGTARRDPHPAVFLDGDPVVATAVRVYSARLRCSHGRYVTRCSISCMVAAKTRLVGPCRAGRISFSTT